MDISLHYENVYLKPNFNTVSTRSSIDTEINFLGKTFSLPVIPANMKCCVDYDVCKFLDLNNYFYIMHRFDIDIIKFVEEANDTTWMNKFKTVSISLGIRFLGRNHPVTICPLIFFGDRKSTRLNSSHSAKSRMPSSA